ncbi:MAG TPA: hypothetical protein VIM85_01405 [Pseudomonadales bacterium]
MKVIRGLCVVLFFTVTVFLPGCELTISDGSGTTTTTTTDTSSSWGSYDGGWSGSWY